MWYIQSNLIFYGLTISFHRSKEVFVCSLIVTLRCVFWVAPSIRGGGIDSPRPASQRAAAFILTAAMLTTLAAPAFAGTWYIEDGDITVKAGETEGTNKVSQGANQEVEDTDTIIKNREDTASSNTVTINAEDKNDKVEVTLKDVNIDTSSRNKAAVSVTGSGNTTIKLDGDNHLTGGNGIYSNSSGSLTISGDENDSLTAQGGDSRNGIYSVSGDVTISGGKVTATGGNSTGSYGSGGDGIHSGSLTISGGTVTATGGGSTGSNGLGGRGICSDSGGVTISGGTVKATGGNGSDGGSGISSSSGVTISGGIVTATGGDSTGSDRSGGDGISSTNTTISGGTVTATGGDNSTGSDGSGGNGIYSSSSVAISGGAVTANGGSGNSSGGNGIHSNGVTISSGSTVTANGGRGEDGSGGSGISNGGSLTVSDGTVTAKGGNGDSKDGYGGDGIHSGSTTISGGTVTADGGSGNFSGGNGIRSFDVAISGGTVNVAGGNGGNGSGSDVGNGIISNDIDLSGSLELTAKAGSSNGKALSQNGKELDLDTIKDKLDPGAKVTTNANGETKEVSIPRPVEPEGPVIPEESSSSSDSGSSTSSAPASPLPGLTVTDKDGQRISYTSTQSGNTLTVCVGRFTASFRISLAALRQLRAEGIDTITFQTILCSTTLSVDELLAMGGEDAEAVLTHRFTDSSLTVG